MGLAGRRALLSHPRTCEDEHYHNQGAAPFQWNFRRTDMEAYLERLARHEAAYAATATALAERREQVSLAMIH